MYLQEDETLVPNMVYGFTMNSYNCVWSDILEAWNTDSDNCYQDEDLGGTGHGDESFSDSDPGL